MTDYRIYFKPLSMMHKTLQNLAFASMSVSPVFLPSRVLWSKSC